MAETKTVRRGINNNTQGTTRLKFNHTDAQSNGLFIAHIDSVEVSMIRIGEETTGMPSFNGLEIPKLVVNFSSNEANADSRKYIRLQFNAVESNVNTIPGGKEDWKVNLVFDWLKHLLNVFVLKGRPMSETEEAALALDYIDFDENGDYLSVAPEDVIASWKKLFENFANIMNTSKEGKPSYFTADGKPLPIWIKLIRYYKTKKGWSSVNNGNLSFPQFPGEGCIEIFKQNQVPSIRLDAIREDIRPRKEEEKKAPNMPGVAGSAPMGSFPAGGFAGVEADGGFGGFGSENDMPFD